MEKLILHCRLSPGDVVMLTAAIEALHVQHPQRFLTDVRTSMPGAPGKTIAISPRWTITILEAMSPYRANVSIRLIHQSNQLPYHFIHGYVRNLSSQLGVPLEPAAFRGNIHLSAEEAAAPSLVEKLTGSGASLLDNIGWRKIRLHREVVAPPPVAGSGGSF